MYRSWMYHLIAIISHRGTLNGGHYWTYLQKNGTWFKLNDSLVKRVQTSEVASSQAYMVFYEKRRQDGNTVLPSVTSDNQE